MSIREAPWKSIPVRAASAALALLLLLVFAQPRDAGISVARGSRLLVADFVSDTGSAHLGPELKELLELTLEQSTHVLPLSRAAVHDSLRRLGRNPALPITFDIGRQLCIREGLFVFLQPRISWMGNAFLATARLISIRGGLAREVQVDMVRAKDEGELLVAMDELGRRVRKALGESRESLALTSGPLPAYDTTSPEALHLFAKALVLQGRMDCEGHLALLEQAVALDPHFALARMQLASHYARLGQAGRSFEQLSIARENAGNLPPHARHRILGAYYSMSRQFPEAISQWRSLAAIYPGAWTTHLGLAKTALMMGNTASAVAELQAAFQADESRTEVLLGLCLGQLLNRNPAAARDAWELASALEPEDPEVIWTAGLIDLVDNNLGAALRAFQKVCSNPSGLIRSYGTFLVSQAQVYGGRFRSAIETLAAGIEEDERRGDADSAADKRLVLSQIRLLLADPASALAECARISDRRDALRMAYLGATYARLGHAAEARELLGRISQVPSAPLARAQTETLRGEIEIAEGRVEDAVRRMTKAKELEASGSPLEPLARALALAGRWDQAANEYRTVCEQKAAMLFPINGTWFTGTWVRSLFDAGRCAEKVERRVEAQQYYRNYLWVMDGADASLDSLQEAKARLRKR